LAVSRIVAPAVGAHRLAPVQRSLGKVARPLLDNGLSPKGVQVLAAFSPQPSGKALLAFRDIPRLPLTTCVRMVIVRMAATDVRTPERANTMLLEGQMRTWSYGFILPLSVGILFTTSVGSSAQSTKGLFSDEKVTLACQSYVNALYPPTTGQMDRQREMVYRACLRRKGK
jgi:hypothetical protein